VTYFREKSNTTNKHYKTLKQQHTALKINAIHYCKTLNFGHPEFLRLSQFNYFGPVILAFCFLLHWNATVFKFSRPVIFANLPGSQNSRNNGHVKKTGFTVFMKNCSVCNTMDSCFPRPLVISGRASGQNYFSTSKSNPTCSC